MQTPAIRHPVATRDEHVPVASLHESTVQASPSSQTRGTPAHEPDPSHASSSVHDRPSSQGRPASTGLETVQRPVASQASSCVQTLPSSQGVPIDTGDQDVPLRVESQTWQRLAGLTSPSCRQLPPTKQKPGCGSCWQRRAVSSQRSIVHDCVSSQERGVPPVHAPVALQVSPTVQ